MFRNIKCIPTWKKDVCACNKYFINADNHIFALVLISFYVYLMHLYVGTYAYERKPI